MEGKFEALHILSRRPEVPISEKIRDDRKEKQTNEEAMLLS